MSLTENKIVDDIKGLGDALALAGDLKVAYGASAFTSGEELAAPVTHAAAPSVSYVADGNAGKKYTIILTDPDAPSRATHEFREFIHWVVSDITAESLATGGAVNGTSVIDYLGVGAPCNSGKHRYVFLLFEQPDGANPASLAGAFEGRGGKKACVEAKGAGLGAVVGAQFFESQWDPSIDAVHIAMGWTPPNPYRSPKQLQAQSEALFAEHGGRFMSKNVDALAEEYDDNSVMQLSVNQGEFKTLVGWTQIRPAFEALFANEYGADAKCNVQGVESNGISTVLLWNTTGGPRDVSAANDTFIINPETNKWAVQTVFVYHA
jgi:phosphatidylethanolamine-binding protein (PEBP) family uncharacterized protein